MSKIKLAKKDFESLVDTLISETKVYGPMTEPNKPDRFNFEPLTSHVDLRLDYDVTLRTLRRFFVPPVEAIVSYDMKGGYKSVYNDQPFILLGVHPYDMIAINQLDALFAQDNYDTHYFAHRNNATIIASDVLKASKDVFASSMKTATVHSGYDILLTDIGDGYILDAATEKGENILKLAKNASAPNEADLQKRQQLWDYNKKNLNKHPLKCSPSYLAKLLDKGYKHPIWEELAKKCFSCGSCNQVCPTCYCFHVRDDASWDMTNGIRRRSWDGCLLDGFTKVAPDHEFRKKRADRIRHRIHRKGKYVPAKIGVDTACIGCGRCVSACLTDIANPVKIYNRLIDDLGIE